MFKIGIGYDIHRLIKGRRLILGGIRIPFNKGLKGHSDADALLHAICDALLGAASEKDIGELFPDTDARYKGISSAVLLKKVRAIIRKRDFKIENIDAVIIAEQPLLSPFKGKICSRIAMLLNIEKGRIGIKAKTNEGFGDTGKGKAIAVYAVALLVKDR